MKRLQAASYGPLFVLLTGCDAEVVPAELSEADACPSGWLVHKDELNGLAATCPEVESLPTRLTSDEERVDDFAWSVSGEWLAVSSIVGERRSVSVRRARDGVLGAAVIVIPEAEIGRGSLAWSPQRDLLAVVHDERVSLVDPSSNAVNEVYSGADPGTRVEVLWSPSGSRLAGQTLGHGVFVVDIERDGSTSVRNFRELDGLPLKGLDTDNYRWRRSPFSPDGRRLAVKADVPDRWSTNALYVLDLDAAASDALRLDEPEEGRPSLPGLHTWSPDGTRVVYGVHLGGPPEQLAFIADLSTTEISLLDVTPLAWLPNRPRTLLASTTDSSSLQLLDMTTVESPATTQIPHSRDVRDWSLSPSGRWLLLGIRVSQVETAMQAIDLDSSDGPTTYSLGTLSAGSYLDEAAWSPESDLALVPYASPTGGGFERLLFRFSDDGPHALPSVPIERRWSNSNDRLVLPWSAGADRLVTRGVDRLNVHRLVDQVPVLESTVAGSTTHSWFAWQYAFNPFLQ